MTALNNLFKILCALIVLLVIAIPDLLDDPRFKWVTTIVAIMSIAIAVMAILTDWCRL